jgi:hypothetical protein
MSPRSKAAPDKSSCAGYAVHQERWKNRGPATQTRRLERDCSAAHPEQILVTTALQTREVTRYPVVVQRCCWTVLPSSCGKLEE